MVDALGWVANQPPNPASGESGGGASTHWALAAAISGSLATQLLKSACHSSSEQRLARFSTGGGAAAAGWAGNTTTATAITNRASTSAGMRCHTPYGPTGVSRPARPATGQSSVV